MCGCGAGQRLTTGTKPLLLGRGETGGRGRGVNAVSVFPPTPKNQEQCNTTVGNRSLLHYSHGSTASKRKKILKKNPSKKKKKKNKDLFYNAVKCLKGFFFFSPFHLVHFTCFSGCLHCPTHSLSSSECNLINGGKEVVKLK